LNDDDMDIIRTRTTKEKGKYTNKGP